MKIGLAMDLNYEAAEGFASVAIDVPDTHPNTRSDLAISAVASFVSAARYDRAVEFARLMLSQPDKLSPRGRGELSKMITEYESLAATAFARRSGLEPREFVLSKRSQERADLREAARALIARDRWMLQTSNSFRRLGARGDGDVLHATKQHDGHPDLQAAPGVLDYIVAAQPCVVIALLEDLSVAEDKLRQTQEVLEKIGETEKRLDNDLAGVPGAEGRAFVEIRAALATLRASFGSAT